jgi:hypothetical protein
MRWANALLQLDRCAKASGCGAALLPARRLFACLDAAARTSREPSGQPTRVSDIKENTDER